MPWGGCVSAKDFMNPRASDDSSGFNPPARGVAGLVGDEHLVHGAGLGVAALEGRPGILSVSKGWRNAKEINRVVFDPQIVSVQKIEEWLKKAGTYRQTIDKPDI